MKMHSAPNSEFEMQGTEQLPSQGAVIDQLTQRLAHAEAMLEMITGQAFETFVRTNPASQSEFLHACWSVVTECREMAGALRA